MSKTSALYMDELQKAQEDIERLTAAGKLALEYWEHRLRRYKNRTPVWVQDMKTAIAKAKGAV